MNVNNVGLAQSVGTTDWRSTVRQGRQDFAQIVQALQAGNLGSAQQAYTDFQQLQSGLTSAATATASTSASPVVSDWTALGQALQSGTLSSAQDALTKLQQDAQSQWQSQMAQKLQDATSVYALLQGNQAGSTTGTSGTGSVQNDLKALDAALQSGDTTSAQKLLAQLEQDLLSSASQAVHRHHHHDSAVAQASAATDTASSTAGSQSAGGQAST
jgi:hypothetical protein